MKMKILFAAMLVMMAFASCTDEQGDEPNPPNPPVDSEAAYISLNVSTPSALKDGRASEEENATTAENTIHALYAIMFDVNDKIVCYGTQPPAIPLTGIAADGETTQKSEAFKISSKSKKLLLIANPGAYLSDFLANKAAVGMTFGTLNAAITNVNVSEVQSSTTGFTMINVGKTVDDEYSTTRNDELCLIDISDKISFVGKGTGQYPDDVAAKAAAEVDDNRIKAKIERLAAKIEVDVSTDITDGATGPNVLPANKAIFTFIKWALDAQNGSVYPWAKKVKLSSAPEQPTPPATAFYTNNFYTIDPNFDDNTGIIYNSVNLDKSPSASFLNKGTTTYCLENTMRAVEQKYKNATRVVIQANYYPDEDWIGSDWFSYAGINYKNFDELQDAYDIPENLSLQAACDKFFTALDAYATAEGITITGADFKTLTQADLDNIPNGGEVVKEDECIRWYQQGLCYYWYEIRHDDDITGPMAFAKYGVVRNYNYTLSLVKVNGPGTPWYPSVDPKDGEKDPEPEDPIDELEGYISVIVNVAPWIRFKHNFEVG